jgi:hypothetical protein
MIPRSLSYKLTKEDQLNASGGRRRIARPGPPAFSPIANFLAN